MNATSKFWVLAILQLLRSLSTCDAEDFVDEEEDFVDEEDFGEENLIDDEVELTNTTFAYIYYTDATCLNNGDIIKGTFNLGYDNYNLTGAGFQVNDFYGSCWYFEGGRYDVMQYDGGTFQDTMKKGRCVAACDNSGLVGCSDTEECADFSSVVSTPIYMSTSSNTYSSPSGQSYEFQESSSVTKDIEEAVIYKLESDSGQSSVMQVAFGALLGFAFLAMVLIGLEGRRKCLSRNSIDNNSLGESLPVTSAVV